MNPHDLHDSPSVEPVRNAEPHPLYWCVRRELWENRSIYLAPLIVAAVVLFGSMINTSTLPKRMRATPNDAKISSVAKPFRMAPAPIMLASFIVGLFYSLDALYGERRDRSILFWKSLPVSDRTTVLSKASIPIVVLPMIAFTLSLITIVILLLLSTMVAIANGLSPARLWAEVHIGQQPLIMFYGLAVHSLWFAPVYAWLLLLSAWARRAVFLWAVLPPFAIGMFERMVFNTSYFGHFLQNRFMGAMKAAFTRGDGNIDMVSQLAPLKFITTPGLWIGLMFAAAFLAAATRLRRNREPI